MRADLIELIERLKEASEGDHARGCDGRQYSCSCGYDDRIFQAAADAATYLSALSVAPKADRDTTIAALQEELARVREALTKIAGVSEYRDGVGLCQFRPAMSAELAQETAYYALAALGGSDA